MPNIEQVIDRLTQQVQSVIAASQPPPDSVVVMFSGGLDSSSLLHCAARALNLPVMALHVNHGIHQQADDWAKWCQQRAQSLGIECVTTQVLVQPQPRTSLEAQAREARYAALHKLLETDFSRARVAVLFAQHANDQLETSLLQMKRGAGPNGIAGLKVVRELPSGHCLVRPWLSITQADIQSYAEYFSLPYIHDDSNDNTDFDRNYLRHQIIPKLSERFPGMLKAHARSCDLMHEYADFVRQSSEALLVQLDYSNDHLTIESDAHSSLMVREVLRRWLELSKIRCSRDHIYRLQAMLSARSDSAPQLQTGHFEVRYFNRTFYLEKCGKITTCDYPSLPALDKHRALEAWACTQQARFYSPKDHQLLLDVCAKAAHNCADANLSSPPNIGYLSSMADQRRMLIQPQQWRCIVSRQRLTNYAKYLKIPPWRRQYSILCQDSPTELVILFPYAQHNRHRVVRFLREA